MSKKIFRETALERLSSPEQLDRMIRVTSPRGWMLLIALWAVVAAVIAWAFLGKLDTTELGKGILVPTRGVGQVVAPSTGILKAVHVRAEQEVTEGQVVGEIERPELEAQQRRAAQALAELRDRHAVLSAAEKELRASDHALLEQDELRLAQLIRSTQERIGRQEELRASIEELRVEGMMTKVDVNRITDLIETLRAEVEIHELEVKQLRAKNRAADAARAKDSINRELEIKAAERALGDIEEQIERDTRIVSRAAGVVGEIRAALNTSVQKGETILTLGGTRRDQGELTAQIYVAAGAGPKIKKGDVVKVLPSTIKREEFGSIVGVVESVAGGPTSRSTMTASLGDPNLVDKLILEIGLPFEVKVSLKPANTDSHYKWTFGEGPKTRISEGTLCSAWVTINTERPIARVIPFFKEQK